jgi:hypothetical protein
MAVLQYFTGYNQPKHVGTIEGVYESRCNQGGARRGDETIILGGIRS